MTAPRLALAVDYADGALQSGRPVPFAAADLVSAISSRQFLDDAPDLQKSLANHTRMIARSILTFRQAQA